jgi:hypothetical protein
MSHCESSIYKGFCYKTFWDKKEGETKRAEERNR